MRLRDDLTANTSLGILADGETLLPIADGAVHLVQRQPRGD